MSVSHIVLSILAIIGLIILTGILLIIIINTLVTDTSHKYSIPIIWCVVGMVFLWKDTIEWIANKPTSSLIYDTPSLNIIEYAGVCPIPNEELFTGLSSIKFNKIDGLYWTLSESDGAINAFKLDYKNVSICKPINGSRIPTNVSFKNIVSAVQFFSFNGNYIKIPLKEDINITSMDINPSYNYLAYTIELASDCPFCIGIVINDLHITSNDIAVNTKYMLRYDMDNAAEIEFVDIVFIEGDNNLMALTLEKSIGSNHVFSSKIFQIDLNINSYVDNDMIYDITDCYKTWKCINSASIPKTEIFDSFSIGLKFEAMTIGHFVYYNDNLTQYLVALGHSESESYFVYLTYHNSTLNTSSPLPSPNPSTAPSTAPSNILSPPSTPTSEPTMLIPKPGQTFHINNNNISNDSITVIENTMFMSVEMINLCSMNYDENYDLLNTSYILIHSNYSHYFVNQTYLLSNKSVHSLLPPNCTQFPSLEIWNKSNISIGNVKYLKLSVKMAHFWQYVYEMNVNLTNLTLYNNTESSNINTTVSLNEFKNKYNMTNASFLSHDVDCDELNPSECINKFGSLYGIDGFTSYNNHTSRRELMSIDKKQKLKLHLKPNKMFKLNGAAFTISTGIDFVAAIYMNFKCKIDGFKFKYFQFGIGVETLFNAYTNIKIEKSASLEIEIFRQSVPLTFYIGPIPITLKLYGSIIVGIENSFKVLLSLQAGYDKIYYENGVKWSHDTGWNKYSTKQGEFVLHKGFGGSINNDKGCLSSKIKPFVRLQIGVIFYELLEFYLLFPFEAPTLLTWPGSCDNDMRACDYSTKQLKYDIDFYMEIYLGLIVDKTHIFSRYKNKWKLQVIPIGEKITQCIDQSIPYLEEGCCSSTDIINLATIIPAPRITQFYSEESSQSRSTSIISRVLFAITIVILLIIGSSCICFHFQGKTLYSLDNAMDRELNNLGYPFFGVLGIILIAMIVEFIVNIIFLAKRSSLNLLQFQCLQICYHDYFSMVIASLVVFVVSLIVSIKILQKRPRDEGIIAMSTAINSAFCFTIGLFAICVYCMVCYSVSWCFIINHGFKFYGNNLFGALQILYLISSLCIFGLVIMYPATFFVGMFWISLFYQVSTPNWYNMEFVGLLFNLVEEYKYYDAWPWKSVFLIIICASIVLLGLVIMKCQNNDNKKRFTMIMKIVVLLENLVFLMLYCFKTIIPNRWWLYHIVLAIVITDISTCFSMVLYLTANEYVPNAVNEYVPKFLGIPVF
eukprot:345489_1